MDDPVNTVSVAEDEIKTSGDGGKEESVGPPSIESVVKPFVEEFTQAEESLVENVTQSSSTYVTAVEKGIENLVSDPWASLKNLVPAPEETLPTSDKSAGGSSSEAANKSTPAETEEEEEACVDENPRATHPQPYAAVAATSATSPASWMNCCGLLDVLRPSDK